MRKSGLIILVLIVLMLAGGFLSEGKAGALGTGPIGTSLADRWSDLVVKIKKKKTKQDGTTQGEHSCPAGYVVLDKPNKYGAFCEPKEGLPAPAPAEAEKCKFGMEGTPPNDCHCPAGTEFAGYKGCIVVRMKYCRKITDLPGSTPESFMGFFELNCNTAGHAATSACTSLGTGGVLQCCCEYDKP